MRLKNNGFEITINQVILSNKLVALKNLSNGSGYVRSGEFLSRGYGKTHDAINQVIVELNAIETELLDLIKLTASALEKGGLDFAEADTQASNKIQAIAGSIIHTGNSGKTHGGNGKRLENESPVSSNENDKNTFSGDQIGTVITNVYGENGALRHPYSQYYVVQSSYSGRNLECVGYVKGRYEELTGVKLNIGGNAIDYQYNYVNDQRVNFVTDITAVVPPAIAVTKGYYPQYGHVILIEDISYHSDGSINQIFYTDGNSSVADGTLKVLNANGLTGQFEPYGFIQSK